MDFLVIKNGTEHTIEDSASLATEIYFRRKELGIKTRCEAFLESDSSVAEISKAGGAYVDALKKGEMVYVR